MTTENICLFQVFLKKTYMVGCGKAPNLALSSRNQYGLIKLRRGGCSTKK